MSYTKKHVDAMFRKVFGKFSLTRFFFFNFFHRIILNLLHFHNDYLIFKLDGCYDTVEYYASANMWQKANTWNIVLTWRKSTFWGIFDPNSTLTPKFDAIILALESISGESLVKFQGHLVKIWCDHPCPEVHQWWKFGQIPGTFGQI